VAGRPWTEGEERLLRHLWKSDLTREEVAARLLGRTPVAIQVRAKRLGLRHTDEQFRRILSKKSKGENNGMFGREGPRRGVVLTVTQRDLLRKKALNSYKNGRPKMVGARNPMFGKPGTMRGKKLPPSAKATLSEKAKVRWCQASDEEKAKKVAQLREGRERLGRDSPSSIEVAMREWLSDLQTDFEAQVVIGFYTVDFLVSENKVIECHGDYWHAHPEKYASGDLDETQRHNVHRDRRKATFLRNRGYGLLVMWESDIKERPSWCVSQVEDFLHG